MVRCGWCGEARFRIFVIVFSHEPLDGIIESVLVGVVGFDELVLIYPAVQADQIWNGRL